MPAKRIALVVAVAAALAVAAVLVLRQSGLPEPGSAAYEEVAGAFYRGLASLEVGLLDDARREFTSATERVPEEPASWANLGLTRLRLGELDTAAEPIERALMLAPDNPEIVQLAGRMEFARGRLDEGLAHLRRVVELDPRELKARFALAEEVERAAGPDADRDAAALLDTLAEIAPDNVAVRVERARLAAKMRDAAALEAAIERLQPSSAAWPERALEQYRALQAAVAAGDLQRAQLTTTFLRNVLASVPSFIENLMAVRTPAELIAEPIEAFVRLEAASPMPAAPDTALRFDSEDVGTLDSLTTAVLVPNADGVATVMAASPLEVVSVSGPPFRAPFPGREGSGQVPSANSLLALDWNNDFLTDVAAAGEGGLRLFIQGADGGFTEGTPAGEPVCVCFGAWAADVEMDGDLDIVAAAVEGPALVLRNDGNGGWTSLSPFGDVSNVRAFAWADLDRDGDPDALFLDREGRLRGFANRRAGDFIPLSDLPDVTDAAALSVADMDADGSFDAVLLDRAGRIQRLSLVDGAWQRVDLAAFDGLDAVPGTSHLIPADLDNNGALDLVVRGGGASRVWMSDETHALRAIEAPLPVSVAAAADLDGDGRLDLIGASAPNRIVRLLNRGTLDYHWKIVRPRAQPTAGDQRINAFGVGGDIEVRSGLLVQKQVLTGGPVHIGLGERTAIDVARIVWPNGVAQAEFGEGVDDVLVAEQRLKGSCPWVFAWDGSRMQFVTDFLWRSPLGLRINAQDTAGVVQTEDWVRIRGDSLAPRDGAYDIRITAELWETHFFDHLALLVVDHPDGSEVYVDERFSAGAPPALKVHAVRDRRAVTEATDHTGADVTPLVSARDGRYLATFEKGRYQGVAEEHFVELAYDGRADVLLASGWIYPTDSSINVAIAQGGQVAPSGLSLEARAGDGPWHVVNGDLGFPAGKNKTVVIDLTAARGATRLRLRTNLEISWDALELAARSDAPLRTTRLAAERAELRYRGFSATTSPRGEAPETPHYDQIATTSQRWRDLVGYHTRFGEVTELVAAVDDRYVIMNAGDEMQVLFPEQPAPAGGWSRDFVLIGDGWEKDGDFNTGFSQTVLPLPSHDRPDYGAGVTSLALEDDPVYQRHKDDWQRYHTRYVTPRRFVDGLQVASPRRP